MNDQYTQAFLIATQEVFNEIGFSKITLCDPPLPAGQQQIIANVGVTGDLQGYFLLKADIVSATNFVRRILENMGMNSDDSEVLQFRKEAIGEILNQVSGRSTMKLADIDIDCDITPPTIITGDDIYIDVNGLDSQLSRIIDGEFGQVELFVGLKKIKQ